MSIWNHEGTTKERLAAVERLLQHAHERINDLSVLIGQIAGPMRYGQPVRVNVSENGEDWVDGIVISGPDTDGFYEVACDRSIEEKHGRGAYCDGQVILFAPWKIDRRARHA